MIFFKSCACKVILSGIDLVRRKIDKESICTTNSSDFTTEIKTLLCFGSITYKNSGILTTIAAKAEKNGEKKQNYPHWMTASKSINP